MQFVVRYLITVGTMFEWLDFVIFAFLMPTLAGQFFPLQPTASYLLTLAIFALGFLSRPIGGVLLGRLGDSKGCQSAFSYSLLLMGLPSILLGVMPTFSQVGWWAPAGLLLLRLIQGISCGGEFTHSFIYLHSMQPTNKMKHTNYAWLGALTGTFLGSVALYLITHFTSVTRHLKWSTN